MAAYSDFAGSMASHGSPARLHCSRMCRTVWDFPAPVAPVTNACRFSVDSGTRNAPPPGLLGIEDRAHLDHREATRAGPGRRSRW